MTQKLPRKMDAQSRSRLIRQFGTMYPEPGSELNFSNEYELVVSVMLSAQCTDKKVNEVTPSLFDTFPTFKKLSGARLTEVERIVRPINYYRTKSKNLISMAKLVMDEFGGALPHTHEELRTLPGVGQKTANVVQNEMGAAHTLPVDTHVFRVSKRLGLARGKNAFEVEEELKKLFKPELWRNLHHWLILHGRRVCKAQRPECPSCKLAQLCPSSLYYLKSYLAKSSGRVKKSKKESNGKTFITTR